MAWPVRKPIKYWNYNVLSDAIFVFNTMPSNLLDGSTQGARLFGEKNRVKVPKSVSSHILLTKQILPPSEFTPVLPTLQKVSSAIKREFNLNLSQYDSRHMQQRILVIKCSLFDIHFFLITKYSEN